MHTEWDLETYYRTLSNYGVRRHTPAYRALRSMAQATAVFIATVVTFGLAYLAASALYTLGA